MLGASLGDTEESRAAPDRGWASKQPFQPLYFSTMMCAEYDLPGSKSARPGGGRALPGGAERLDSGRPAQVTPLPIPHHRATFSPKGEPI